MTQQIRAIETRYKGYRFRSRLEARWAVFMDAAGIAWEYEKEGYALPSGNYLPDFWLPEINCFLEIKGKHPTGDEIVLCQELTMHGRATAIAWGLPFEGYNDDQTETQGMMIYCLSTVDGDGFTWWDCSIRSYHDGSGAKLFAPATSHCNTFWGDQDEDPFMECESLVRMQYDYDLKPFPSYVYAAAKSARFEFRR